MLRWKFHLKTVRCDWQPQDLQDLCEAAGGVVSFGNAGLCLWREYHAVWRRAEELNGMGFALELHQS